MTLKFNQLELISPRKCSSHCVYILILLSHLLKCLPNCFLHEFLSAICLFICHLLEYKLCRSSVCICRHLLPCPPPSPHLYFKATYCLVLSHSGDQVPHPFLPVNAVSRLILLLVAKPHADDRFVTHNKLNHCAVKFCGFLTLPVISHSRTP